MKNIKESKAITLIALIITLIIISSGISVYATSTYLSSQVTYKDGKTVEYALNDLYNRTANTKVKDFIYNDQIDKLTNNISGGYPGFAGTFSNSSFQNSVCKYYSFSEGDSHWSCGCYYKTDDLDIYSHEQLVINYAKIYASGPNITNYVAFLNQNDVVIDVIPITDNAIEKENKIVTIDLGIINKGAQKIMIGAQSGVAKDNIYGLFVLNSGTYRDNYNGSAYAYIKEMYFYD